MDGQTATSIMMFVFIILIFYFLIMRPQKKREKETKAMLDAMKKGDKVISIGGIHGTVLTVKENSVIVKVDDNCRIEFTKNAISQVVNKGATKSAPKKEAKAAEEKKEEASAEVKADDAKAAEAPKAEETK